MNETGPTPGRLPRGKSVDILAIADKKEKKKKEKTDAERRDKEKKAKRDKSRSSKSAIVTSNTTAPRDKDLENQLEEKKKEIADNLAALETYVKSEQRKSLRQGIFANMRSSSERDVKSGSLEPKSQKQVESAMMPDASTSSAFKTNARAGTPDSASGSGVRVDVDARLQVMQQRLSELEAAQKKCEADMAKERAQWAEQQKQFESQVASRDADLVAERIKVVQLMRDLEGAMAAKVSAESERDKEHYRQKEKDREREREKEKEREREREKEREARDKDKDTKDKEKERERDRDRDREKDRDGKETKEKESHRDKEHDEKDGKASVLSPRSGTAVSRHKDDKDRHGHGPDKEKGERRDSNKDKDKETKETKDKEALRSTCEKDKRDVREREARDTKDSKDTKDKEEKKEKVPKDHSGTSVPVSPSKRDHSIPKDGSGSGAMKDTVPTSAPLALMSSDPDLSASSDVRSVDSGDHDASDSNPFRFDDATDYSLLVTSNPMLSFMPGLGTETPGERVARAKELLANKYVGGSAQAPDRANYRQNLAAIRARASTKIAPLSVAPPGSVMMPASPSPTTASSTSSLGNSGGSVAGASSPVHERRNTRPPVDSPTTGSRMQSGSDLGKRTSEVASKPDPTVVVPKRRSLGRASGAQMIQQASVTNLAAPTTDDPARSALPLFMSIALAYLEITDSKDLFLRSADSREVANWRSTVAKGKFEFGQCPDPNIIADLLAEHLSELPEPLLSADYASFLSSAVVDDSHWRNSLLRSLVHLLPTPNRATLQAVINFLANLGKRHRSQENSKITQSALANALAPIILRQKKDQDPDPNIYPLFDALVSGYDAIFAREDREIKFGLREGKLVALSCSIDRLVLEMLNEYYVRLDPEIVDVFLITHRYFVQAPAVLKKLQAIFPVSDSSKWETKMRVAILQLVQKWVIDHPAVMCHADFQGALSEFISLIGAANPSVREAEFLQFFRNASKNLPSKAPSAAPKIANDAFNFSLSKVNLLTVDAMEIAGQATLIDHELLKAIPAGEFLKKNFMRPTDSPCFTVMVERFNRWSQWVPTEVLVQESASGRADMLEQFIRIADACVELQNFNTACAIMAGLQHSAVSRLKQSWEKVSKKEGGKVRRLQELFEMASNFKNYREAARNARPPSVAYLGIFPKDIFAIEENNPNEVMGLMNMEKMRMLFRALKSLERAQEAVYSKITPDANLQSYLKNAKLISDEEAYDASLRYEPRK